jgi:hypothetical protein
MPARKMAANFRAAICANDVVLLGEAISALARFFLVDSTTRPSFFRDVSAGEATAAVILQVGLSSHPLAGQFAFLQQQPRFFRHAGGNKESHRSAMRTEYGSTKRSTKCEKAARDSPRRHSGLGAYRVRAFTGLVLGRLDYQAHFSS